jgi:hypothetical membrane protein
MNEMKTQQLREIQKEKIKAMITDIPGVVMVGVALFGIFGEPNNVSVLSFLENKNITYFMLAAGLISMSFHVVKILQLAKREQAIRAS